MIQIQLIYRFRRFSMSSSAKKNYKFTGLAIHQIAQHHETDSDVMEAYLQITKLGDRLETLNDAVQSTMSSMRYVRSNIDAMIAIR